MDEPEHRAPVPGASLGDGSAGTDATELGAFIREQRRERRLSIRKLAQQSGVSNPYLSQIERGLRRPSADILRRLADALSVSAETLYVQAGMLDEPTAETDVIGEIRRDRTLTGEQQMILIRIYESFRLERREETSAQER